VFFPLKKPLWLNGAVAMVVDGGFAGVFCKMSGTHAEDMHPHITMSKADF